MWRVSKPTLLSFTLYYLRGFQFLMFSFYHFFTFDVLVKAPQHKLQRTLYSCLHSIMAPKCMLGSSLFVFEYASIIKDLSCRKITLTSQNRIRSTEFHIPLALLYSSSVIQAFCADTPFLIWEPSSQSRDLASADKFSLIFFFFFRIFLHFLLCH